MVANTPLPAEKLYARCDPADLGFDTTAALDPPDDTIGQDRALAALQYGVHAVGEGTNVFALGPPGIHKHDIVKRILEREAVKRPVSSDWCYVYNFTQPHKPNALELPPGRAARLRLDMEQLIEDLGSVIPAAFQTEDYQSRIEELERDFAGRRDNALLKLSEEAKQNNIRFLHTHSGFAFAPMDTHGEVIEPDAFKRMLKEDQARIQERIEELQRKLQKIIRQLPAWQKETREKAKEIDREIARNAVGHLIEGLKSSHGDLPEVVQYLGDVEKDVIEHVREFRDDGEATPTFMFGDHSGKADALRRYKVNVIVEHEPDSDCAAVVYQDSPSYTNLVGRIEYQSRMGALITEFTLIKAGDLHRANGGYLILDADRILRQPFAWEGLKRALRAREIHIEPMERVYGLMSTVSLEPEPIPLDVKVVLVGDRRLYYLMNHYDPDFADLFSVAADFNDVMQREPESVSEFARLIARTVRDQGLRPLDAEAVARMIEHSSRLAGDSRKLSINMRAMFDLLRESDYQAGMAGSEVIQRKNVQQAIDARVNRHDRLREATCEAIERGLIKIDTSGEKVGQINGLAVLDLGDYSFGQPSRITVTTRLGDGSFLDIQRESEMGGNLHSKGVLILTQYLSSRYARDYPLSLSASIAFEQSYGMVDGDSASLAELCALLSSISEIPIRQAFAVTGSVNQRGEAQAIGGVNQKIEGFFDICVLDGLDGNHGVIIPASNVPHLMLRHDVVAAVEAGRFSIHAVDTVDQAIELLTGVPAGAMDGEGAFEKDSVNHRVEQGLVWFALRRREWSQPAGQEPEGESGG